MFVTMLLIMKFAEDNILVTEVMVFLLAKTILNDILRMANQDDIFK